MTIDSKSQLSLLRLRQELGMPTNAIIGYSEIIIKEMQDLGHNVEHLDELKQIYECGVELLASINNFLNPVVLPKSYIEFQSIVGDPQLRTELEKPTQLVINSCQQLMCSIEQDFVIELEKINHAANKLLREIKGLIEISHQEIEHPKKYYYRYYLSKASRVKSTKINLQKQLFIRS